MIDDNRWLEKQVLIHVLVPQSRNLRRYRYSLHRPKRLVLPHIQNWGEKKKEQTSSLRLTLSCASLPQTAAT